MSTYQQQHNDIQSPVDLERGWRTACMITSTIAVATVLTLGIALAIVGSKGSPDCHPRPREPDHMPRVPEEFAAGFIVSVVPADIGFNGAGFVWHSKKHNAVRMDYVLLDYYMSLVYRFDDTNTTYRWFKSDPRYAFGNASCLTFPNTGAGFINPPASGGDMYSPNAYNVTPVYIGLVYNDQQSAWLSGWQHQQAQEPNVTLTYYFTTEEPVVLTRFVFTFADSSNAAYGNYTYELHGLVEVFPRSVFDIGPPYDTSSGCPRCVPGVDPQCVPFSS
eukprot:TRINITY_DN10617_c0_g1_i1.p1 TRINITY_DN10617_c0_g1~~TRINITY_DN10617_c0_g1_i1.p1  ORF type:complete len:276 (+),score=42.24 TRINITY_DN10617_c0_g1_i1:117-944(+)